MKRELLNKLFGVYSPIFAKLSIAKKIYIGILGNIVLMTFLIVFTIVNIQKFNSLANRISKKNYKSIKSARVIGKVLAGMAEKDERIAYVYNAGIKGNNKNNNSTLEKVFENNKIEVNKHLQILYTLIDDPVQKKNIDELEDKFVLFCFKFYKKIELLKFKGSEGKEKAKKIINLELSDDMQRNVKSIIKANDESIESGLRQLSEIERYTTNAEWVSLVTALLYLSGFGYFLHSGIRKPISILESGTQSISRGEFGKQIEVRSNDEFGRLASAFNNMSERVKKLDEMKSDFIYIVTHELKTPLTSMKEATSLLKDEILGPATPKQKRFLNIVEEDIERLLDFIKALLDLVKMEGGLYHVGSRPTDIAELIVDNITQLTALIREKEITIVKNIPKYIPPVSLDSIMIDRVLTNLIGNALKYSPNGGKLYIEVVLGIGKEMMASEFIFGSLDAYAPAVGVFIRDEGIGIETGNLQDVFSKFYQVKTVRSTNHIGSGLGLSIAKEIILAHNGIIGVKNNPKRVVC